MADENLDKMIAKAQEIKNRAEKDKGLAQALASDRGKVICAEILDPQVIASSGEPAAVTRCTCLIGASCGSGCQGLVGQLSGTYGCVSGKPI